MVFQVMIAIRSRLNKKNLKNYYEFKILYFIYYHAPNTQFLY